MRWILFYLLAVLSTSVRAGTTGTALLETRYGILDGARHADTVQIRFRGKIVRSFEALDVSLYRVTPKDQREFVIVDGLTPGLYCHHVFYLVELYADGKAEVSNQFGACKELKAQNSRVRRR